MSELVRGISGRRTGLRRLGTAGAPLRGSQSPAVLGGVGSTKHPCFDEPRLAILGQSTPVAPRAFGAWLYVPKHLRPVLLRAESNGWMSRSLARPLLQKAGDMAKSGLRVISPMAYEKLFDTSSRATSARPAWQLEGRVAGWWRIKEERRTGKMRLGSIRQDGESRIVRAWRPCRSDPTKQLAREGTAKRRDDSATSPSRDPHRQN